MAIFPTKHKNDLTWLKSALVERPDELINSLFAGRPIQKLGHEYRIGNNGSVQVRCRNGGYNNYETGQSGDVISLIQHALNLDFKGALAWAQDFVGGHAPAFASVASTSPKKRSTEDYEQQQRNKALAILRSSTPISGTLAEIYLRERRKITLTSMPADLRFVSAVYNFMADDCFPALVAAMRDEQGRVKAAHVIFLDSDTGDKITGKGIKAKLTFGGCKGAAVQLVPADGRIALVEGVEDALTVIQTTGWPCWAVGGSGNISNLHLSDNIREVAICADRDAGGLRAAFSAAEYFSRKGRTARVVMPPGNAKDWNQYLQNAEKLDGGCGG